eukprot:GFKZ01007113.1.p3 GENE.GFKZ01007113.1~~GFKZ01007113.1.p3  ORF type:complete len:165 (-),score=23.84 GFKZ01007113.1:99-593(-)
MSRAKFNKRESGSRYTMREEKDVGEFVVSGKHTVSNSEVLHWDRAEVLNVDGGVGGEACVVVVGAGTNDRATGRRAGRTTAGRTAEGGTAAGAGAGAAAAAATTVEWGYGGSGNWGEEEEEEEEEGREEKVGGWWHCGEFGWGWECWERSYRVWRRGAGFKKRD